MYIEIHNWGEFEQKTLYFKLNNAFNMNLNIEQNIKIAGIYAIYKDDICLYVGQSKNLASRIATHLKGKYKNCDNILCFDIRSIGFYDFYDRAKETQQKILDNCEKYLMTKYKPIENIDIDMSFSLKKECTPIFFDNNNPMFDFYLKIDNEYEISITDGISYFFEKISDYISFYENPSNAPFKITLDEITDNINSRIVPKVGALNE